MSINRDLLQYICDETEKNGFAVIAANFVNDAEALEQAGYADIDPSGKDAAGNIRVAATEDGADFLKPKPPTFAPTFSAPVEPPNADPFFKLQNDLVASETPAFVLPSQAAEPAAPVVPVWARPNIQPVDNPSVNMPSAAVFTAPVETVSPAPVAREPEATVATERAVSPSIRMVEGLTPPAPRGKRGRPASATVELPFDALEIGKAFYIEPTDAIPQPEKFYYSVVRSQNNKYSIPVRDAQGNIVNETVIRNKTIDGIKTPVERSRPVVKQDREFAIYPAKSIQGSIAQTGAYVFRIK